MANSKNTFTFSAQIGGYDIDLPPKIDQKKNFFFFLENKNEFCGRKKMSKNI